MAEHAETDGSWRVLKRRRPENVAELDALHMLPATTLIHNDSKAAPLLASETAASG